MGIQIASSWLSAMTKLSVILSASQLSLYLKKAQRKSFWILC